jgi:hypothetical protein
VFVKESLNMNIFEGFKASEGTLQLSLLQAYSMATDLLGLLIYVIGTQGLVPLGIENNVWKLIGRNFKRTEIFLKPFYRGRDVCC